MKNKISIAFDINGVLTESMFQQLFNALDKSKCHLIVWSSMGSIKAKEFCEKNNINADEYLEKQVKKVDIAIDDQPQFIINAKKILGVK